MSTQFNFPANPNPGDIFVLPGGGIGPVGWHGVDIAVGDTSSTVTYPLPITQGGTAGLRRLRVRERTSGINTATGEFIVHEGWHGDEPGVGVRERAGAGLVSPRRRHYHDGCARCADCLV